MRDIFEQPIFWTFLAWWEISRKWWFTVGFGGAQLQDEPMSEYGNHKIDGTLGTVGTVGNPFHEQQEIRNAKNGNNWNWWCIVSNILANNVWFVDKTGFFVLLQLLHWTPIGTNSWRNMSLLGVQSLQELKLIEVDLMVFHHWGRQQMAGTQPLSSPNSQGQGTGVEIMQQVGSYMMLHGDSKYFFMV